MVGKLLGNFIGEFLEYDPSNDSSIWHNYMRIQVKVDVRVPLKNERKVWVVGREWCVVSFKYEKLGIFCFVCGCLGHTEQKCEVLFAMEMDDGVRVWNAELWVEPRRVVSGGGGGRWLREDKGATNPDGSTVHVPDIHA